MLIADILNLLHLILVFLPIAIFFIDKKYVKGWFIYFVLISLLTPLHWKFFNDECISTILTRKIGDFKETETTSSFSERYLKWLYEPLMTHIFKLKWNSDGLGKMVHIHWILNFILIWFYSFFRYCPQ